MRRRRRTPGQPPESSRRCNRGAPVYPVDDVVKVTRGVAPAHFNFKHSAEYGGWRRVRRVERPNLPLQPLKLSREGHAVWVALEELERARWAQRGGIRIHQPRQRGPKAPHQQRHLARDIRQGYTFTRSSGKVKLGGVERVRAEDSRRRVDGTRGGDERLERRGHRAGGERVTKRVVFANRRVVVDEDIAVGPRVASAPPGASRGRG